MSEIVLLLKKKPFTQEAEWADLVCRGKGRVNGAGPVCSLSPAGAFHGSFYQLLCSGMRLPNCALCGSSLLSSSHFKGKSKERSCQSTRVDSVQSSLYLKKEVKKAK